MKVSIHDHFKTHQQDDEVKEEEEEAPSGVRGDSQSPEDERKPLIEEGQEMPPVNSDNPDADDQDLRNEEDSSSSSGSESESDDDGSPKSKRKKR